MTMPRSVTGRPRWVPVSFQRDATRSPSATLVLDLEAQIVPIRQRARGGARGVEIEIRIGHLWTVKDETITRLEVFPAREDARKAAEGG